MTGLVYIFEHSFVLFFRLLHEGKWHSGVQTKWLNKEVQGPCREYIWVFS